eukprot:6202273-Pleurochrysis_carterae.AAC.1
MSSRRNGKTDRATTCLSPVWLACRSCALWPLAPPTRLTRNRLVASPFTPPVPHTTSVSCPPTTPRNTGTSVCTPEPLVYAARLTSPPTQLFPSPTEHSEAARRVPK